MSSTLTGLEVLRYTTTPPLGVDFPKGFDLPMIINPLGHLALVLNFVSLITRMSQFFIVF